MQETSLRIVKLLLVADCPLQRESLRQAFAVSPHLQILAERAIGEAFAFLTPPVAGSDFLKPDLLVIDLPHFDAGGIQATFALLDQIRTETALRGIPWVMLVDESTLDLLPDPPSGIYCPIIRKPQHPAALRKMAYHFGEYWGAVSRIPLQSDAVPTGPPSPATGQPAVLVADEAAELPSQQFIEILVVDDNDDDATLFQEALAEVKGIRVTQILDDGEAALQFLRRQGAFANAKPPDIVVLDIHMPRKTGLMLLEEIQNDESLRKLPVVMLTASRHEKDIWDAYSRGSCSFVEKPPRYEWFRDLSTRFANYWTLLVHLPRRNGD